MQSRVFLAMLLLSVSWACNALHLPNTDATPGGIVTVPFDLPAETKPEVTYQGRPVLTVYDKAKKKWLSIIGVPLNAKPGKHELQLAAPFQKTLTFTITDKTYRVQRLFIKNKRKVTPNTRDRIRIEKEKQRITRLLQTHSQRNPLQQEFAPPVTGPITSPFGLRREFNGIPQNPHTGLDIAAASGTPVLAPASGVVLATGNFFYTGNTVFVDHGSGLLTLYGHLQKILVQPKRHVAKGTRLGLVGKTGRATGPHLHWTVILNQTRVNPLLIVDAKQIETEQTTQ